MTQAERALLLLLATTALFSTPPSVMGPITRKKVRDLVEKVAGEAKDAEPSGKG